MVLLVHGLGGTSNFYQPQVGALAERFTVVRPDMEGSGRSTVRGRLTIEGFANDLADLLKTLDAGPARVVGHSMATITVRLLAARVPSWSPTSPCSAPSPRRCPRPASRASTTARPRPAPAR